MAEKGFGQGSFEGKSFRQDGMHSLPTVQLVNKLKSLSFDMKNMEDSRQLAEDEKFMRKALDEAEAALAEGEIPVGAVVVCKGRIIARAHNLTETLCDVTAHAEMQAVTSAASMLGGKYLTDCTVYVTLEPCVMCAGALGWAQVKRVVYGASDEKRGFTRFAPNALHPKATVTKGVLEEECSSIVTDFFRNRR